MTPQLWHFNTDQMKSWVHSRIEWPLDQAGGWWLPEDISEDYCNQLIAEQRRLNPAGKVVWIKVKTHNHYLDVEALAYLAARIVSSGREFVMEGQNTIAPRKQRWVISRGVRLP